MKLKSIRASKSGIIPEAFLISVALAISFVTVLGQDTSPQLTLTSNENGFTGTYSLNGETYAIENHVIGKSFKTRITRPDGRVLVESSRNEQGVSVSLPTGDLKIDSANPSSFSANETKAIQDFLKSRDAAIVRQIVFEVIKKRKSETQPLLNGFTVIAMLLGEA